MKDHVFFPGWRSCRSLLAALILAAMVTGCGGGVQTAEVGTGGTGTLPTSVTGKVADGYLVNATVFLDKNGNYQLDAGEPFTTTDASGVYTLKVDPADVGKYPIVALAMKDVTVDKDTNTAVTASYVLSLPKDAVSGTVSNNFISPMTSLVREMLESGLYSSMTQAVAALATKMGLAAGTDVMGDYLAAGDSSMHLAAQNVVSLMSAQSGQVMGGSGSTTTVDVNRYRTMMGTIFSNISSVMGTMGQGGSNSAATVMSQLGSSMATTLATVPPAVTGQPFRSMSSSFKGMGGMK